jgi:hypothetical protein
VHQVDPAGDGLDLFDGGREVPAGGERVAGVQAEPGAELADLVPQPGDDVEVAGDRVLAAGGVLDQDRDLEAALLLLALEELAPVVQAGLDLAPIAAAPSACCVTFLRDGIRIRLFSEATLMR